MSSSTRHVSLSTVTINLNDFLEGLLSHIMDPGEGYNWIVDVLNQVRDLEPVDPLAVAVVETAKRRRAAVRACSRRFRARKAAAEATTPVEPSETL